mmetsp:Transcript_16994/g.14883  ORF Transcript_16994/g.14883 Transcript_16994/m.14883 type:complete len:80 (+) Transcript_16994:323-562(+)|eukprot:CAMPEP_0114582560 /NCGR_PEP_ID=MMETSP0125-20121206/6514_1 /TAXON_ID=485358 ORGANISM="Aristerostoma sp., Strain ATCC 50986" /NCGR_SAMPLE_ID=MMETSP0125 /ASSEMBLY_ACC=CAM_ASM_000245 /LENGTH=79 /DNA_ID=CAMNT_0001775581 /DNA_START=304 /DNA_END=543 /DNA_ORIENTATION=+
MGECRSTIKARYAQMAGAKMLVVISHKDDVSDLIIKDVEDTGDINIPVVIINSLDGETLLASIKDGNEVELLMHFPQTQ